MKGKNAFLVASLALLAILDFIGYFYNFGFIGIWLTTEEGTMASMLWIFVTFLLWLLWDYKDYKGGNKK